MQGKSLLLVVVALISIQVCLGQFQSAITYSDSECTNEIGVSLSYLDACTPQNCTQFPQTPDQHYKIECADTQPQVPPSFVTVGWSVGCSDFQLLTGVTPGKCVTFKDFLSVRASYCYLNNTLFDFGVFDNCSYAASQSSYPFPQLTPETLCYTLTLPGGSLTFTGICATPEVDPPIDAPQTPSSSPIGSSTPMLVTPSSAPSGLSPTPILSPGSSPLGLTPTPIQSPSSVPVMTSVPVVKTPTSNLVSGAVDLSALTVLCVTLLSALCLY